jgi:brefeldin A-resistance guanine nucleotide exchange factor 1
MNTSAEMFNSSTKGNIEKLMDHGFLPRNADAETIAAFLKSNPAIDKEVLGEYLG